MSVGNALGAAISGLRTASAGLALIGQNVANADNPSYTRKILRSTTRVVGEQVVGVRSAEAQRTLDTLLQRTLRVETAGGTYADTRARYVSRLDGLFGPPGSEVALDAVFNRFTGAVQELAASPENPIARGRTLSEARALAQRIAGIAEDIQAMRLEAEQGLADAVARANDALGRLEVIDKQIIANSGGGRTPVNLLDQRDAAIDELARLMDIRVDVNADNSVAVFTRSGVLLYDRAAITLDFDQRASIGPENLYDPNPALRSVGTISSIGAAGLGIDLVAQNAFRSGEIAALLSLRDRTLVAAQGQLDELASGLALALSDKTLPGAPETLGAQTGFTLDVSEMQPGDTITLRVVEAGQPRTISIVRVDDPAQLPLPANATALAGDQVIGVSFAGGPAAAAAAIQTALGANFQIDSPVAGTLRFLDDGAAGQSDVLAASARVTEDALDGGTPALPVFVDLGGLPDLYSASFESGPQKRGFAYRLGVNPTLLADPSRLVVMDAAGATPAGDPTRPSAILDRLTKTARLFSGVEGLGSDAAPPSATVADYARRLVSVQGQQAETESRLAEGQSVVVNGLRDRFDEGARVDVDEEMTRLIELQQSFQASARIISVVDEMMKALLSA